MGVSWRGREGELCKTSALPGAEVEQMQGTQDVAGRREEEVVEEYIQLVDSFQRSKG